MATVAAPQSTRQQRFEHAISTSSIENHLQLLAAFRDLRRQASAVEDVPPPYSAGNAAPSSTRDQWTVVLLKALVRFEMYLTKVLPRAPDFAAPKPKLADLNIAENEDQTHPFLDVPDAFLPPLDVALIWSVYMLNPLHYNEDLHLVDSRYALLRYRFPLGRVLDSPASRDTWAKLTGTPFDVLAWDSPSQPVACPACGQATHIAWEDLATDTWSAKCASCSSLVSRGSVLGKRWAADAARWTLGGSDVAGWRMLGGALSPHNARFFQKDPFMPVLTRLFANQRETTTANHNILDMPIWTTGKNLYGLITTGRGDPMRFYKAHRDVDEIGRAVLDEARQAIDRSQDKAQNLRSDLAQRVSLLMRCYAEGHPLSEAGLDLVRATQRQFHFTEDMDALGWLDAPKQADAANVQMRHYAWLGLAPLNESVIPTLDVDLA